MVVVWAAKMRVILYLLLSAVCVLADKNGNKDRRTKPFIADAVGNTLPPPSNGPATVGSPISLLTPDRYEFYTFDESGELVKKLMTLEEIQAIVAAGEDPDGLVTFANDNQPTVAFNFSQPPYTKVHSVVTNVQNVLKAQMEAHKNKPLVRPTLDTPDVSDTWSLILPSIFGNSGADIVPDKPANSFIPETETIEENLNNEDNISSKEDTTQILSSTTVKDYIEIKTTSTESINTTSSTSTSTTTTTKRPTTTRKVTTTTKPLSSTTIRKKLVTTTRPRTTTTKHPTTARPTTTTTTIKPIITTSAVRTTSTKLSTVTKKPTITSTTTISNDIPTAKEPSIEFEKISTFIPVSTVQYITEKTTQQMEKITKAPFVYTATTKRSPVISTKSPKPLSSTQVPKLQITTIKPILSTNKIYVTSTPKESEFERLNLTTVTTQSVSPSATVSSTEFISSDQSLPNFEDGLKNDVPALPLFDVAQSISQIASDLGNNYQPLPTTSNLLDTTKLNGDDMESKENLDMDIPNYEQSNKKDKNDDNFVKISTIDPHPQEKNKEFTKETVNKNSPNVTTEISIATANIEVTTMASPVFESTTMDPVLTESMEDLLSQVVHEAPQSILDSEKSKSGNDYGKTETTEKVTDATTDNLPKVTSSAYIPSTTQKTIENQENKETNEIVIEKEIASKNTTDKDVKNPIVADITIVEENSVKETIKSTTEKEILINVTSNKDTFLKDELKKEGPIKITADEVIENNTVKQTSIKDTIKNNSSLQNVPNKIVFTESNKVNIEKDNEIEKIEGPKDFVQISVSEFKNSSNTDSFHGKVEIVNKTQIIEYPDQVDLPEKQSIDDTTKKDGFVELNDKKPTLSPVISTTTEPTKLNGEKNATVFLSQSNDVNKLSTGDKLSTNNIKDKIPDPVPKVDEFKKKIQKINDEELANNKNDPWKLIPSVSPPKSNDISKDKLKPDFTYTPNGNENKDIILEFSNENQGLEVTTKDLGEDIAEFTELCNELAFRYWNTMVENIDKKRSFVLSPYSITSMLAMMFMGARGATSGEMNEILKLDDMVTFNPHFTLKNISDSIESATNSGIIVSAFVRELFSDRTKGKILTFYKERAQHFYSGHVEEINFKLISDIIRRRTNLLVKKHTWGKIPEYMKTNSIVMKPPLAAFSTNIFQTDCTGSSVDGRDGEMYFVVSPNVRQRRLVPVPAVVFKSGFLAGYDPVLDATAGALGNTNSIVSTIFLMPGQQGNIVHADDLVKLEQRLLETNPTTLVWKRILRTLLPRPGLELQIPRFSHKSVFNVSSTLREMGLKDLFDADQADLGGLNGPSKDLYLSDMIQLTSFATCGEGMVGDQHHIEEYPDTLSVARRRTSRWADWDEPRDYQRAFHDPHDVGEAMHLPLHLRPRQARVPTRSVQPARLKFDRPFLFFVRHNPSGMILYVGRYNPRLLP